MIKTYKQRFKYIYKDLEFSSNQDLFADIDKDNMVSIGFKMGDSGFSFIGIKLYDSGLAVDRDETAESAYEFAQEIVRRWNSFNEQKRVNNE
jgi:hypothetical protein